MSGPNNGPTTTLGALRVIIAELQALREQVMITMVEMSAPPEPPRLEIEHVVGLGEVLAGISKAQRIDLARLIQADTFNRWVTAFQARLDELERRVPASIPVGGLAPKQLPTVSKMHSRQLHSSRRR